MSNAIPKPTDPQEKVKIVERLLKEDRRWRLNNLYWIEDETGQKVKFHFNWAQEKLYDRVWSQNIVLKARQLGISTFALLYGLDECLFGDGSKTFGIIDRTEADATKKLARVRFAYDHLDDPADPATKALGALIKARCPLVTANTTDLAFANGAKVWAGTSPRGGTLQILHVSEYGHTAAHFPEKAEEIRSGALNTVPKGPGNYIFIESTFEGGRYGRFYEMLMQAMERRGPFTDMDWQFHFFPWWGSPGNKLESAAPIPATYEQDQYFQGLRAQDIELTQAQRNWYVKKAETNKEAMFREYPSTPTECFQSTIAGSIYGKQMMDLRADGRILDFEYNRECPLYAFWDLGFSDHTAIWFCQFVGLEIHWLDCYCNSQQPLSHYIDKCREVERDFRTRIHSHFMPHDADKKDLGSGKSIKDVAEGQGLREVIVVPRTADVWTGIDHLRGLLPRSYFHKTRCSREPNRLGRSYPSGISCLEAYHTEDASSGAILREAPVHDETSHYCDAARCLAEADMQGKIMVGGRPSQIRTHPIMVYRDHPAQAGRAQLIRVNRGRPY